MPIKEDNYEGDDTDQDEPAGIDWVKLNALPPAELAKVAAEMDTGPDRPDFDPEPEPDTWMYRQGERDEGNQGVWETLAGHFIPYAELTDKHLLNIERSCNCAVIPTQAITRVRITAERTRRGLEPLPPFESYDEGHAVSRITRLWVWWPRLPLSATGPLLAFIRRIATDPAYDYEHDIVFARARRREGYGQAERSCLSALREYMDDVEKCSDAARLRCAQVLRNWAAAMKVDIT